MVRQEDEDDDLDPDATIDICNHLWVYTDTDSNGIAHYTCSKCGNTK